VTPGYFRALGIELVRGRTFDDHDDGHAPGRIVVSETFARTFFPGVDPIGKRVSLGRGRPPGGPIQAQPQQRAPDSWLTIVGIVGDVKTARLDTPAPPVMYRSVLQVSTLALTLVVRTTQDPAALGESIRREVRAVDPNEPVFSVRTMDAVVAAAFAERRFTMVLLALFAATALVLSAIGIYGITSYAVAQRTREIGIRMALGAQLGDVLKLVLSHGVKLTIIGVVIGLLGAYLVTRAITSVLYGVSATDPLTFGSVSLLLAFVALLACYVPAKKATKVDPLVALRYE